MKAYEAVKQIRNKINDNDCIEYTDDELYVNLNEAIQFVSAYLVSAKSPWTIVETTVTQKTFSIPDNFIKTAGYYPMEITGKQGVLLDKPPMKLRYFSTCSKVATNDDLPYANEGLWQIMIKLAAIYALNRNEFNIQQDKMLLDEVNAQLAKLAAE